MGYYQLQARKKTTMLYWNRVIKKGQRMLYSIIRGAPTSSSLKEYYHVMKSLMKPALYQDLFHTDDGVFLQKCISVIKL